MSRNQIDGDQVQDETLTGADLLDDSVQIVDLEDYSFQTLEDVDFTSVSSGDKFEWNGTKFVPYKDFKAYIENSTGLINNTNTLSTFLNISVIVPVTTTYEVCWHYVWSHDDGAKDFIARVRLDGSSNISYRSHTQEPKDVAGTGEVLPLTTGGSTNSGTDQRHNAYGSRVLTLSTGTHTIAIEFAGSANNDRAAIYGGNIKVKRF